jgi:hypothetical protein
MIGGPRHLAASKEASSLLRTAPILAVALLLTGCSAVGGSPGETGGGATRASTRPSHGLASIGPSHSVAPTDRDVPTGTLTVIPFTSADGPGLGIAEAVAAAPLDRELVNGSLLIDPAGQVWLCEALDDATPPSCVGARLRVMGFPTTLPDDIQEASGVRWLAQPIQLLGNVTAP